MENEFIRRVKSRKPSRLVECKICGGKYFARGIMAHQKLSHGIQIEKEILIVRTKTQPLASKEQVFPNPEKVQMVSQEKSQEKKKHPIPNPMVLGWHDRLGKFTSIYELSLKQLRSIQCHLSTLIDKRETKENRYKENPILKKLDNWLDPRSDS
jgi:hypothetical protein